MRKNTVFQWMFWKDRTSFSRNHKQFKTSTIPHRHRNANVERFEIGDSAMRGIPFLFFFLFFFFFLLLLLASWILVLGSWLPAATDFWYTISRWGSVFSIAWHPGNRRVSELLGVISSVIVRFLNHRPFA